MKKIENIMGEEVYSFLSPFREIDRIGDPFALWDEKKKRYYVYCTGGKYKCWSSADMKEWQFHGDSYQVTEKSFGDIHYWAPEVYLRDGVYYMAYSSAKKGGGKDGKPRHSISVARSEDPEGPFVDFLDKPLLCPDYSVIDASLFFDDDGRVYLTYSRDCSENYYGNGKKRISQIYGVEIAKDLSSVIGEPVLLSSPSEPWELVSGDPIWNEGPCIFKKNGTYYLLFTANYYASVHYCVGYATSSSPLGEYKKAKENPILVGDGIYTSGTGHCNYVRSPDMSELYMVYHSHSSVTNDLNPIADRTPCFDKMQVTEDGRLVVSGASWLYQPLPSGLLGQYKEYENIKIENSYPVLEGSLSVLRDGVSKPSCGREYTCTLSIAEEGKLAVSYTGDKTLLRLWLFISGDKYPESLSCVINGEYEIECVCKEKRGKDAPIVIGMGALPEGVKAQKLEITFEGDTVTLSEIVAVVK